MYYNNTFGSHPNWVKLLGSLSFGLNHGSFCSDIYVWHFPSQPVQIYHRKSSSFRVLSELCHASLGKLDYLPLYSCCTIEPHLPGQRFISLDLDQVTMMVSAESNSLIHASPAEFVDAQLLFHNSFNNFLCKWHFRKTQLRFRRYRD